MEKMTQAEYLAAGGNKCPHCRSEDISGGSIEVAYVSACQEVYCSACTKSWIDTYTLDGYMET